MKVQERTMEVQLTTAPETENRFNSEYYVEGFATTFSPYLLYHDVDGDVYENIKPTAFENARMNDVIFQYDHAGRVYARQSNDTLYLEVRPNGLFVCADLGKTQNSRNLYEDIKAGMITKMSWRFTIPNDGQSYDPSTRTISINKVREVFDVSAVSIPANSQTSISARGKEFVEQWKENERKKRDKEIKRMKLKLEL